MTNLLQTFIFSKKAPGYARIRQEFLVGCDGIRWSDKTGSLYQFEWIRHKWQEEQIILEKQYVENFIKQNSQNPKLLEKLEFCLLSQKWISAKSSAHQYTFMKDYSDIEGIKFDDITDSIGKYGFFGYYWCDLYQYLVIGNFYYWSSLYPGSWALINRARIDTPPKEAYFSDFSGKWAKLNKPNIKCFAYQSNPFNGKRLIKNPFNGNPIREFNIKLENFEYGIQKDTP